MPEQLQPEDRKTIAVIGGLPDSFIVFRKELVKTLAASGHRVIACASTRDPLYGTAIDDPIKEIKSYGCEFQDIPTDRATVDPRGDLKAMAWMTKYLRELRPDVVITYSQKQVIFSSMAAIKAKVPRVVPMVTGLGYGLRDYEAHTKTAKIVRLLYKFAFRKIPLVIFQNPDDMGLFRRLGILTDKHKTVIVNGSGVDIQQFQPAEFPTGRTTFLLIGRLMKAKGVFEYIEAAKLLKARGRDVRVILVGPYEEHPQALKRGDLDEAVKSGLIEYPGSTKDVRSWIASCHVYVLPSYHEGTPKTVLEAMAMGRPIIVTDAPGCRETIVDGENGLMVPLRDPKTLANAMERFITEPELIPQFGRRSREIAIEKYASDKVAAQIAEAIGVKIAV